MEFELKQVFATLPQTVRGSPIVLGGDPKGKNFVYTNRNSVIIRDIANPAIADVVSKHPNKVSVAKYSPSGFYIASCGAEGKVKIWDTVNKEHILKYEYQPFVGEVRDLAWTEDSKRIAVVGEGRERFGHVIAAETGTSVGEIMGHSKILNSCDFKLTRPYRLVTAGDDGLVNFFEGPPFKLKTMLNDQLKFVNTVRYAPDGSVFVSGGSDGKAYIYDGKTAEMKGELGGPAHKGGIYGMSFSADSKKLLTVSGDKTAKIWDMSTSSVVQDYVMGTTVSDMQVGCLWQGDYVLTVSLTGYINYLDANSNSPPYRIIKGHQNAITAMDISDNRENIITSSFSGEICNWRLSSGDAQDFKGKSHTNQVNGVSLRNDELVTCAMDDTVMYSCYSAGECGEKVKLPSQPKSLASAQDGLVVVACVNNIVVLRNKRVVFSLSVDYEPSSVDIRPGQTEVAVGSSKEKVGLRIYNLENDTLVEKMAIKSESIINYVKYSPDGANLATCEGRQIRLYETGNYERTVGSLWVYHTASSTSCAWSDDNQILSGGMDSVIGVVTPENKNTTNVAKSLHNLSTINEVRWLDNFTIVTAGTDACVRIFTVKRK